MTNIPKCEGQPTKCEAHDYDSPKYDDVSPKRHQSQAEAIQTHKLRGWAEWLRWQCCAVVADAGFAVAVAVAVSVVVVVADAAALAAADAVAVAVAVAVAPLIFSLRSQSFAHSGSAAQCCSAQHSPTDGIKPRLRATCRRPVTHPRLRLINASCQRSTYIRPMNHPRLPPVLPLPSLLPLPSFLPSPLPVLPSRQPLPLPLFGIFPASNFKVVVIYLFL